jgi:micrococcal nuclease
VRLILPLLVVLGLAFVSAAPATVPAAASRGYVDGTVSRVVDGDTIHVTDAGGARVKVRVLGIDTPETVDPRKPVQCWGPEASAWAKATLAGKHVTLVTDPTQDARDRYGRVLAYPVLDDGTNYSVLAAREGMARSYVYGGRPVQEHPAIAAAEADARAAGRGLWGACS